ncbi:MAG: hypothetical protein NC489_41925 [Ruminococcus flavefaciens]|nr:hypothetical protein [Ruminococcus flavefaciens]
MADTGKDLRTVTIKDFTKGQDAYIVPRWNAGSWCAAKVRKVAKTFIETEEVHDWPIRFVSMKGEDAFLSSCGEYGFLLFPDKDAMEAYIEKDRIYRTLKDRFNYGPDDLTPGQLQAIWEAVYGSLYGKLRERFNYGIGSFTMGQLEAVQGILGMDKGNKEGEEKWQS